MSNCEAFSDETASLSSSSVDNDLEKPMIQAHKISLINILEISASKPVYDSDLDSDQEEMMSQALHAHTKYDRSRRAQKLEQAIKAKRQTSQEAMQSSRRHAFTATPSHNAIRFCRRPKQRASSEGGSPIHTLYSSHHSGSDSPHCQVSVTSLNANVHLPMDRLSTKLFNPPERSYTAISSPRRPLANGGSCFGGRSKGTTHYTIHPDWVSESFSCSKAELRDRGGQDLVNYMKRSQSCPPAQRNIITWEMKSGNKQSNAISTNGSSG